jgi:adenylate cyclase
MLRLTLFGDFSLMRADGGEIPLKSKKAKALLTFLALPLGKAHSREEVMALLWADRGEAQARASLRQVLSGLRKELGEDGAAALKISDDALSLDPDAVVINKANGSDELLAGFQLHDPAFEEWLRDERLRLEGIVPVTESSGEPLSPDKPSVAVLPFHNLSGDPKQQCFADGLTEDLITDLSRFRDLFVIAPDSSFAYKNRTLALQEVSRELGVRYILEGSIQKSSETLRITAQLVDGHSGRHLWAQRYDRPDGDIFAVQDDVAEMIVGALATGYGGRLRKAWQGRADKRGPQYFQAYDCFARGLELFNFKKEDTRRARALFREAMELDSGYAKPCAKLAWVYIIDAIFGWADDYGAAMEKGRELALQAIERDDEEAWAYWPLAGYYLFTMRHDLALAELEKALELNLNDADIITDVALILTYAGRPDESLETAQKAMRLNPHNPEWYLAQLGQIFFDARRYEDSIATFERLRTLKTPVMHLYFAASLAAAGRTEEARRQIDAILKQDPGATLEKWTSAEFAPYKDPEDGAHFLENLRKAGLPE